MGVNNSTVHNHVQSALDDHTEGSVRERLYKAFQDVNAKRKGHSTDLNLAASDHYLFMRWMACTFSPAFTQYLALIVTGYDGVYKGVDAAIRGLGGPGVVFKTDEDNAPSDFSPLVMAWSYTGIIDGNKDFSWRVFSSKLTAPAAPVPIAGQWF